MLFTAGFLPILKNFLSSGRRLRLLIPAPMPDQLSNSSAKTRRQWLISTQNSSAFEVWNEVTSWCLCPDPVYGSNDEPEREDGVVGDAQNSMSGMEFLPLG